MAGMRQEAQVTRRGPSRRACRLCLGMALALLVVCGGTVAAILLGEPDSAEATELRRIAQATSREIQTTAQFAASADPSAAVLAADRLDVEVEEGLDEVPAPDAPTVVLMAIVWAFFFGGAMAAGQRVERAGAMCLCLSLSAPLWFLSAHKEERAYVPARAAAALVPFMLITAARLAPGSQAMPPPVRTALSRTWVLWATWLTTVALLAQMSAHDLLVALPLQGAGAPIATNAPGDVIYNGVALAVLALFLPWPPLSLCGSVTSTERGDPPTAFAAWKVGPERHGSPFLVATPLAWALLFASTHLCFHWQLESRAFVAHVLVEALALAYPLFLEPHGAGATARAWPRGWLQCHATGAAVQATIALVSGRDAVFQRTVGADALFEALPTSDLAAAWAKTNCIIATIYVVATLVLACSR